MAESKSRRRVLLVQCCNIPQWVFVWRHLQELHPDWEIEGLALDHPQVRFYAEQLLQGENIHYLRELPATDDFSLVVYPLLNRGYRRIKQAARSLSGNHQWVDYRGTLRPMTRVALLRSMALPLAEPDPSFAQYLQRFPHRPLGEKLLLIESAHPGHLEANRETLLQLIPAQAELTRVSKGKLFALWRSLRRQSFDGAVVYFTGEPHLLKLKLLPFILRVPRLLIINENGEFFYSSSRSLARFLLNRIRNREPRRSFGARILLIQTASREYVAACAERLRKHRLFPDCRILVVARPEDAKYLEKQAAVDELLVIPGILNWRHFKRYRRRIKEFHPTFNAAPLTGRPVYRSSKALFLLTGSLRKLVFNASLNDYWLTLRTWRRPLRREPQVFGVSNTEDRTRVLLVQTEIPEYMAGAHAALTRPRLYPGAQFLVICRDEDRQHFYDLQGVEAIVPFPRRNSPVTLFRTWRRIRRFRPQVSSAVFTGRPVFRGAKLLFHLATLRRKLVFNAGLDGYWLTPTTLPRLFHREPLRFGIATPVDRTRVLLVQTEVAPALKEVYQRLNGPQLYPDAQIMLICRARDADSIAPRQDNVEILPFPEKLSFGEGFRTWRKIRKFRPQVSSAVFSGRPVFRWAKLLFLFSSFRRQLIFNASLDGYWLNSFTWPRLFRMEPFAFKAAKPFAHDVLLLETEGTPEMLEALEIVRRPHVVPHARITVFCAEEREASYRGQPDVDAVVTYRGGAVFANLFKLRKFMGRRPDVVAALFSGRRIFLKHKLLFWMIPARSRLAFNEDLDCFYVRWGNLANFRRNRRFGSHLPLWRAILLPPAKVILFLPRFAFLLLWNALQRLKFGDTHRIDF